MHVRSAKSSSKCKRTAAETHELMPQCELISAAQPWYRPSGLRSTGMPHDDTFAPFSRCWYPASRDVGKRSRRSHRLPTHPVSQLQELLVAGSTVGLQTPLSEQSRSDWHLNGPGGEYGGVGGGAGGVGQPGLPGCTPTEPDTRPFCGSPRGVDEAAFR
jgi:hypothetical protein